MQETQEGEGGEGPKRTKEARSPEKEVCPEIPASPEIPILKLARACGGREGLRGRGCKGTSQSQVVARWDSLGRA